MACRSAQVGRPFARRGETPMKECRIHMLFSRTARIKGRDKESQTRECHQWFCRATRRKKESVTV
jgi:hypothetical protein